MNTPIQEEDRLEKNGELQLVSFRLGEEEYGVDILKVQEINRMLAVSKVPRAPAYIEGIINLRGKVIPLISLRQLFGLEPREKNKQTRIVVLTIAGKILGIVVDSVTEVLRLPASTVEPAPSVVNTKGDEYIRGVGKIGDKLLILLDLDRLFGSIIHELDALTQGRQPQ